jgi:type II secretory pathway predicted ATPase ExeA
MSAYLEFFELQHSPFDTGPRSSLVLGTQALRDAFARIEAGLEDDAPRLCVNGRSGLGKTSLARALPKLLHDRARVALLLNPSLPWSALRGSIVKQLDLEDGVLSRQTLVARRAAGQRLVLVIDAAERIGGEALEHLDILLGYRTDDDRQLVHCVLLANLDHAREHGECPLLWWLDSLHTLQLEFAPIPVAGVRSYIVKHLKRAGWKGGELFTAEAARAIHRLTGGVPRSVSQLCEKVLEEAAQLGETRIDVALVEEVAGERPRRVRDEPPMPGEEMLLETVVSTGEAEAPAADAESGGRPPRSAGLDAFFGPAEEDARQAPPAPGRNAPSGPTPASHDRPSEADEGIGCEPDVESRGGWLRAMAIAAGVLVLLAAGVYAFVSIGPGDDAARGPLAEARADTGPSPTERLARRAGDAPIGPPDAPSDGPELAPFMRTTSGATPPTDRPATRPPAEPPAGDGATRTAHVAGATSAPADPNPAADPRDASSVPAAPAPGAGPGLDDRMDRAQGRHF